MASLLSYFYSPLSTLSPRKGHVWGRRLELSSFLIADMTFDRFQTHVVITMTLTRLFLESIRLAWL